MVKVIASSLLLSIFIIGCAGIEPPHLAQRVLPPWSDGANVKLGENKDSVRDKWGEPDEIRYLGVDDVGLRKEEWIYRDRYPEIPMEGMLFKGSYLIFTGDSLTSYGPAKRAPSADKE